MRDVEGIKDAVVDIVNMELVVTAAGGRVDLRKVIESLRAAGYEAREKR